jgi:hypothetical protein
VDNEKRLRRELEVCNLAYALLQGLHTDPRWQKALRRVLREQREERDEK